MLPPFPSDLMKAAAQNLCGIHIIICLLVCSCQFNTLPQDENPITTNGWLLHQMDGETIHPENFPGGIPRLKFHPEGNMEVYAGCQYLSGSFIVQNDTILLKVDSAPSKNCIGPGEIKFLRALKTSNNFMLGKERLFLLKDTTILMSFFPK
jgi:heat shock protein HslJ